MKYSKEELSNLEYNDAFEYEEPDDYSSEDCCYVCGSALDNLTIGFNKTEQLYRYECASCGAVFIIPENSRKRILLKGEERNWPDYLSETLQFPFEAEIIESTDREFFDMNYDGPCRYEDAVPYNLLFVCAKNA